MQTKQTQIEFSEQLIKGKIAEMIFSQMFRDENKFTVIPFGYETTFPEIAQYGYLAKDKQVFDTIRNAPDFALVSHDKKEVYLVEVKYRNGLFLDQLQQKAQEIQNRWKSVRLFIATPTGFFFDDCNSIISNNGNVSPLDTAWITKNKQTEYLKLLNDFISKPNIL